MLSCVQELSVLQVNTEGRLTALETDLQAARSTVTALEDRNKNLGEGLVFLLTFILSLKETKIMRQQS